MSKIQAITLQGWKWFDKKYGNTYFSAQASVLREGASRWEDSSQIEFQYGYGSHWEYEILKKLNSDGVLDVPAQENESPWRYQERTGVAIHRNEAEVKRERDLYF